MTSQLKSARQGQTLVLTISNPDFKNALGPEIYAAGIEALNAAEGNQDIRSVVITGEGNIFCAGGNLQRLLANRLEAPSVQADSIEGLHTWIEAICTYPKPVIAAVEGAAAGAGFSLALACDFCVAADNAVFVMAYSSVALSPDGGASSALAQALPRALANEILMLGERVSAQRLHQFGLVNHIAPGGAALQGALELAGKLNARAPNSLASIKALVQEASTQPLSAQLTSEKQHFVTNLHHANGAEGIQAFLDKRTAKYR